MRISALVLAAAMLAATPAFAQTDPAPATPTTEAPAAPEPAAQETAPATESAQVAEANEEPQQICRTVQRTESRLRQRRERVCGTRAMWDQMEDQNARGVRSIGSVQGARSE